MGFFSLIQTVGIEITVTPLTKSKKVAGKELFVLKLQLEIRSCNFKNICFDRLFLLCSESLVVSFLQPNTLRSLMHVSWLLNFLEPASPLPRSNTWLWCKSSPSRSTPCISGSAQSVVIQVLSSWQRCEYLCITQGNKEEPKKQRP